MEKFLKKSSHLTEDWEGWAVSEEMKGMKTGLILSVIWIFSVATAYPQGRVHFTNRSPEPKKGIPLDFGNWAPYWYSLRRMDLIYKVELVHKNKILRVATLDKYYEFDGGTIGIPGADSSVVELQVRLYNSSKYDSWEQAVSNGGYFPPAAFYMNIRVKTGSASWPNDTRVTPSLVGAMSQVGKYTNVKNGANSYILDNSPGFLPIELPEIKGANLDYVIGMNIEIGDKIYKIKDKLPVISSIGERIGMDYLGGDPLHTMTISRSYQKYGTTANQSFIIINTKYSAEGVQIIQMPFYWIGSEHSSGKVTFFRRESDRSGPASPIF